MNLADPGDDPPFWPSLFLFLMALLAGAAASALVVRLVKGWR